MGSLAAQDMLNHAPSLDVALTWHLRSNHYPPHPLFMVRVAREALEAADDLDWMREIPLPQGCETHGAVHSEQGDYRTDDTCVLVNAVEYRDGQTPTAGEIVESFHLDTFLGSADEAVDVSVDCGHCVCPTDRCSDESDRNCQ